MFQFRRNKSELIVLTGAIYSFVAYLTAFTLEVLFIIDLTRRSNEILSAAGAVSKSPTASSTQSFEDFPNSSSPISSSGQLAGLEDDLFLRNTGLDRVKFESIQAHITVSCLAISILYFVIFITSLILIVALILRSTFMLLVWICAMITVYLPEFCLVAYVSVFCWGPVTRNGQTEIVFYLFRAVLNAIFIFRAHKLFKQLNYEKNFFRLKSGGRTSVSSQFAGYDSPYFIGDSLTNTTINPVFNSSTLNLNRYDYIRDHHFHHYNGGSSRGQSPATNNSELNDHSRAGSLTPIVCNNPATSGAKAMRARLSQGPIYPSNEPLARKHMGKFYLGQMALNDQLTRPASRLSINDDLAECELDLDYRTLSRPSRHVANEERRNLEHREDERGRRNRSSKNHCPMSHSHEDLPSYSTQSLDRRNPRDFTLADQVILKPLGHQPFEYLFRPGSTSNLNNLGIDPGGMDGRNNRRQQLR